MSIEGNKSNFHWDHDWSDLDKKKDVVKRLLIQYPMYIKEDFFIWSDIVEEDSMDDPILKIKFPDKEERIRVVKDLLILKKFGRDN
jgi:hypothetical protein